MATRTSSSVTFSGYFNGTLTADSSNVQLTFTSPTTQTVSLGGNSYLVTMGTYTAPGPPGISNAGSLNAFVTVTPGTGTISSSTPEPTALMLAGLALPCLGLAGWRKRRGKRGMPAA